MILNITFEQITADIEVDFGEEAEGFDIALDEQNDKLDVDFGEVTEVPPEDIAVYDGEYEVNPTFEDQILQTSGTFMQEDVVVEQILVREVSNNAGGITVIIGG